MNGELVGAAVVVDWAAGAADKPNPVLNDVLGLAPKLNPPLELLAGSVVAVPVDCVFVVPAPKNPKTLDVFPVVAEVVVEVAGAIELLGADVLPKLNNELDGVVVGWLAPPNRLVPVVPQPDDAPNVNADVPLGCDEFVPPVEKLKLFCIW